ncbi:MAG: hypothetical protein L6Q71_10810, partial [Planctomycetes bacterium]|nr:hypothetical protein [Planctomycetota bacterium]
MPDSPNLNAVLLCDAAVSTGKWNLIGIFSAIMPKQVPFLHHFQIYVRVADMHTSGRLRMDISRSNGDNGEKEELWSAEIELRTSSTEHAMAKLVELGCPVQCIFPDYGVYDITVRHIGGKKSEHIIGNT